MSLLTDIVCIVVELVQSAVKYETKSLLFKIDEQAKAVEYSLRRLYLWCGLLAVSMLVLLVGVGFVIAGVFMLLATAVGSGLSALIVGVIISLAASILMITIKSSRK